MSAISFRERFIGVPHPQGGRYAPSTIGAPHFTHQTDYKTFKKDGAEKLKAQIMKAQYKKRRR